MKIFKTEIGWWEVAAIILGVVLAFELVAVIFFYHKGSQNLVGQIVEVKTFLEILENTDFSANLIQKKPTKKVQENEQISLLFGGDVMLGRSVNTRQLKNKNMTWAWQNIADELNLPDITMVNLEAPIVDSCIPTDEGMIFCVPKEALVGLVAAGVDVVNLANNHTLNQGAQGLWETKKYLNEAKILWTGTEPATQHLAVKKVKGMKIGFLGYDDISQTLNAEKVMEEIAWARPQVDLLVTNWHWGVEYESRPRQRQISLAHQAIEAGADLVIGHHPHWVQTHEVYLDKPIYYSLGNLIFDQMWSEETKRGLMVEFVYEKGEENLRLEKTIERPIYIENYGQARFVLGKDGVE